MNAVLCNSCGRTIGDGVQSNVIKPKALLPSYKCKNSVWDVKFDALIAKGFDPSRVHFCKPCLTRALISGLHKLLPAFEAEMNP